MPTLDCLPDFSSPKLASLQRGLVGFIAGWFLARLSECAQTSQQLKQQQEQF